MFNFSNSLRNYQYVERIDMGKAFNGLYAIAKHQIELNALYGSLFLFANRWRDHVKFLYWYGTGFWVLAKRLEKAPEHWEESGEVLTEEVLVIPAKLGRHQICKRRARLLLGDPLARPIDRAQMDQHPASWKRRDTRRRF
jgi:transposase